jgi:HTH-type transcriptional regulator, transcriptional repressor of NAD biosynthesis genes
VKPAHGLVLGKFYPPHAGHHLLIRTAAATCAQVTVLALTASWESLPLALRVAWLREVHASEPNVVVVGGMDDHPVDYGDARVWDAHMQVFESLLAEAGRPPVDAVFTSEAYGDELARRLGARHCLVDLERGLMPVSGTAVRADPASHWELLSPPVRAHFARRVVIVGAESTGKTTLARELRDALAARGGAFAETRWVPEVGREYTLEKLALARALAAWEGRAAPGMNELDWPTSDFVAIARAQNALEEREARVGGPVLICDTDAFATGIWHERYRGAAAAEVDALGAAAPRLYLVTHHDDVPFQQDGIRDGEHLRAWMTARFAERLHGTRHRVVSLRGARSARLVQALAEIDAWLRSPFAPA